MPSAGRFASKGLNGTVMKTYLSIYCGSAFLALLVTPVVIWVSRRINALDYPGVRAIHTRPIPRIGGVSIFFSATWLVISSLFLNNAIGAAFWGMRWEVVTTWCMAAFIFAVGLADDLKGLPARTKLAAEFLAACVLCVAGIRISTLQITDAFALQLGSLSYPFTILWIIGITNAVNLSDGLDGLAAGISAVTCGVIAWFSLYSDNVVMAVFMLALLGSLSGFLLFNFNPARVFMGDCGSLFLGFTIAASSAMCVAKSAALVGLTLPALALGVPIFDTLCAMLRRFLEGRSLFAPDRSHFHHRLLELGLRQRQAVLLIYLVTLLAAGSGLFMLLREDIGSLVVFGSVLLLLLLLFRVVGAVHLRETFIQLKERLASAQQQRQERQTFEQLQLRVRQVNSPDDWWQTVCQAGEQLDLAWISLHVLNGDGPAQTIIWRRPDTPQGMHHIVAVKFPLAGNASTGPMECEIAVLMNGRLESANHRANLFSRLANECVARHLPRVGKTIEWNNNSLRVDGVSAGPACSLPDKRELKLKVAGESIHERDMPSRGSRA